MIVENVNQCLKSFGIDLSTIRQLTTSLVRNVANEQSAQLHTPLAKRDESSDSYVIPDRCFKNNVFLPSTHLGISVILQDFKEKIGVLFLEDHNLDPLILELEHVEIQKFRPFSWRPRWSERSADAKLFFQERRYQPCRKCANIATEKVTLLLRKESLRPLSLDEVYRISKKNTQWGLPFMKKGSVGGLLYLEEAKAVLNKEKPYKGYPFIAFCRTQLYADVPKVRLVWGSDHVTSLLESTFVQPVTKALLKSHPEKFCGWGDLDDVDRCVTNIMKRAMDLDLMLTSVDAAAFDRSIAEESIRCIFNSIKSWFQRGSIDDMLWDDLVEHFITGGLITPEGVYLGRKGGVPSGTGFTSLVTTLVHCWLFYYVEEYLRINYHVEGEQSYSGFGSFHGDDGIWVIQDLTPSLLADILKPLNITINASKSMFDDSRVQFLQRLHLSNYIIDGKFVGIRSISRTFCGMVFPERFNNWPSEMHSVRWISQLENCKYHPYFKEFVKFVASHDKYELGLKYPGGIDGLFKACGGTASIVDQLSLISYLPTQFYRGQSPSSLETVRLLNQIGMSQGKVIPGREGALL